MTDKEIFKTLAACGFRAGDFETDAFYRGFRVIAAVTAEEIEKTINEVFDDKNT